MNFCPNKAERYAAALRVAVHRELSSSQNSKKIYENLQKLYRFEQLARGSFPDVVDLQKTSEALCRAAVIKGLSRGAVILAENRCRGFAKANLRSIEAAAGIALSLFEKGFCSIAFYKTESALVIAYDSREKSLKRPKNTALSDGVLLRIKGEGKGAFFIPIKNCEKDGNTVFSYLPRLLEKYSVFDVFSRLY